MESFNINKLGYGQLNQLEFEDHINSQKPIPSTANCRAKRVVAISVVLLTLILASLLAALIYDVRTEADDDDGGGERPSTDPVKSVCSVTLYPDSCFTDISTSSIDNSGPKTQLDPLSIFTISLKATLTHVSALSPLSSKLISEVNDPRAVSALRDCQELFSDAFDAVNRSVVAVSKAADGKMLKEELLSDGSKMGSDLRTWISAAMTDEQTCLDGLEESGASAGLVDQVKAALHPSTVSLSNSLAILANLNSILDKSP